MHRNKDYVQSLSASWKAMLKVNCPHCGQVHEISVRETYIDSALQDATDGGYAGASSSAPRCRP
jgi:hypothetical protein